MFVINIGLVFWLIVFIYLLIVGKERRYDWGYNKVVKRVVVIMLDQNHFRKLSRLLKYGALVAVTFLGIFLLVELVINLWGIGSLMTTSSVGASFYVFIDEVTKFFIVFEFLVTVIEALRSHGHVSITMLIDLGLTSLLRQLLAEHGSALTTMVEVAAIVLLIVGLAIYRYFVHEKD